jgi:spermidine synthase
MPLQRNVNEACFMALDDKNWFTEICTECGSAFSLQITGKLHEEETPFQTIAIYDTIRFGKLMTIDGYTMVSSLDNFLYHEMMSHPAIFTHPDPKRVLIIGGGDCGTLREVLKHPGIEAAHQVEIDERVTRLAEQYFPELTEANEDPRAELMFIDGIQYVADSAAGSYDVIIIDSTDPIGQAARLFGTAFYSDCHKLLGDQGILVAQSESPLMHPKLIKSMRNNMLEAGFADVATLPFPQPLYPSGWWSATMAGKRTVQDFRAADARDRSFDTNYYTPEIHRGALTLPPMLASAME